MRDGNRKEHPQLLISEWEESARFSELKGSAAPLKVDARGLLLRLDEMLKHLEVQRMSQAHAAPR